MKIYVIATTESGILPTDIVHNKYPIKGVITLSPKIGQSVNEYYDFSEFCNERKLDCIYVDSYSLKNENDRCVLLPLDIDLLLVLSWQRLIPKWLINKCRIGVIGVHGSPWGIEKGRGRSPQNWALILGEKQFEISIFWIDADVDSGEVIDSRQFSYDETDDINTSYIKSSILIGNMIVENLENEHIQARTGVKQQSGHAEYLPQRTFEDGMIDWNRRGKEIYNFVRALTKPYPGAFTKYDKTIIYLWDVKYIDESIISHENICNGTLVYTLPDNKLLIKCSDGYIYVNNYSVEGQNMLNNGILFESASYQNQIKSIIDRHNRQYDFPINKNIIKLIE